jgi:Zn-dependent M28 family amino/carboxypeptidase
MTTVQRLGDDVKALCAWADRAQGSPRQAAAREYLIGRFSEMGLHPYAGGSYELRYRVGSRRFVNVVGVVPGAQPDAAPVLIGAHYDTIPGTPGADDNAAAIAIALEVARRCRAERAERPVVIAHFDAEEPPFFHSDAMGSTRFVADQMGRPVHAAIVLDLVGHAVEMAGLEDVLAVMGSESHPALAGAVAARTTEHLPVVTLPNRLMADMSDHYAFRLADIPYLFLSCGQWRHYHLPTDTPDRLDYGKMARVADWLEALVRDAARLDMAGASEHDTAEADTAHLRAVLGPRAARLGLRGRGDFDRVMRSLIEAMD